MSLHTLFELHIKSKKGGLLAKPAPKKWKTITYETLHVEQAFMKMTILVDRCLKRKTM